MKRIYPLLVVGFVLALAVTVYAQRRAGEQPDERTAISQVLAKIERLEDQVARLEAQVQALRGRQNVIVTPPVQPAPGPRLPEGWQQREYRGMKYYIVPCDPATGAPATQPVK